MDGPSGGGRGQKKYSAGELDKMLCGGRRLNAKDFLLLVLCTYQNTSDVNSLDRKN